MKALIRRIEKLEKRHLPTPEEEAYGRYMAYRLESGRRRVAAWRGEPVPAEPLEIVPDPGKVPKSWRRPLPIVEILNKGRRRVAEAANEEALERSNKMASPPTEPAMQMDAGLGDSQ